MEKLKEIANKPKPLEARDTQEIEGKRKMTQERNMKTEITFSILKEEDTELLQEV